MPTRSSPIVRMLTQIARSSMEDHHVDTASLLSPLEFLAVAMRDPEENIIELQSWAVKN